MTKREKILSTTLRLIAERGVLSTPVSLIAKESSVAIGTIYHHFRTKEDILSEILLDIRKKNETLFKHCIREFPTKRKQFVAMWMAIYKKYINNPLIFHFTQYVSKSKLIPEKSIKESKKYFQILLDFFEEGIEEDEFAAMSPQLMTSMTHNSILTYVELILTNLLEDNQKNLHDAIEFSWHGIRK